jgi:alkane 1-monooxygenase
MLAQPTLTRPLGAPAFLLSYIVPLCIVWSTQLGGLGYFLPVGVVFGLIPLLDCVLGTYPHNPTAEETEQLLKSRAFRWVSWSYVPVLLGLTLWGAWLVSGGNLTALETLGLTVSVGVASGGIGITLAHELIHKTDRWERLLGQLLLLNAGYMHFYIEHLRGHHRHVSTPQDPASARWGESFYRFYPRTVLGSWRSAWAIEAARLHKRNVPLLHWRNQMLWFALLPLAVMGLLGSLWGPRAALFFGVQAIVAFSLLEAVNYVEHYGLARREVAPGRYEPTTIHHSWNANHLLTNCFLFMLQRHSDHHAHQSRRYPVLRQFDESPQLPTGYAGMILLALVPPLWRRVMHPRLAAWRLARSQEQYVPRPDP